MNSINRRRFERFQLKACYTPVSVRVVGSENDALEGHAYDVSEGGAMFELDEPIEAGTPVAMQLTLPLSPGGSDLASARTIFVFGNVVWLDLSEPGPARMAIAFTQFAKLGDKERLLRQLGSGLYARAA
ncbi:MAG: PilZ domain-containing protein [Planctomycetota bacterium]